MSTTKRHKPNDLEGERTEPCHSRTGDGVDSSRHGGGKEEQTPVLSDVVTTSNDGDFSLECLLKTIMTPETFHKGGKERVFSSLTRPKLLKDERMAVLFGFAARW